MPVPLPSLHRNARQAFLCRNACKHSCTGVPANIPVHECLHAFLRRNACKERLHRHACTGTPAQARPARVPRASRESTARATPGPGWGHTRGPKSLHCNACTAMSAQQCLCRHCCAGSAVQALACTAMPAQQCLRRHCCAGNRKGNSSSNSKGNNSCSSCSSSRNSTDTSSSSSTSGRASSSSSSSSVARVHFRASKGIAGLLLPQTSLHR